MPNIAARRPKNFAFLGISVSPATMFNGRLYPPFRQVWR
jgi:hypothetical protein